MMAVTDRREVGEREQEEEDRDGQSRVGRVDHALDGGKLSGLFSFSHDE